MLGTGNATVTECYNTCFVLSGEGKHLLVDGGGGNTVLRRLKQAGTDWKDIRDIFVTHKHIDHLLGIIWMARMICQNMSRGTYDGEARIYAHDEVIALIDDMARKLLGAKESAFIGKRLHLITVGDGEEREIIGRKFAFFDILSTKAKQYGFCMDLGGGERNALPRHPLGDFVFGEVVMPGEHPGDVFARMPVVGIAYFELLAP